VDYSWSSHEDEDTNDLMANSFHSETSSRKEVIHHLGGEAHEERVEVEGGL
jgi:hypothetical protein